MCRQRCISVLKQAKLNTFNISSPRKAKTLTHVWSCGCDSSSWEAELEVRVDNTIASHKSNKAKTQLRCLCRNEQLTLRGYYSKRSVWSMSEEGTTAQLQCLCLIDWFRILRTLPTTSLSPHHWGGGSCKPSLKPAVFTQSASELTEPYKLSPP